MTDGEHCLREQIIELEKDLTLRDKEIDRLRKMLSEVIDEKNDQEFRDRLNGI